MAAAMSLSPSRVEAAVCRTRVGLGTAPRGLGVRVGRPCLSEKAHSRPGRGFSPLTTWAGLAWGRGLPVSLRRYHGALGEGSLSRSRAGGQGGAWGEGKPVLRSRLRALLFMSASYPREHCCPESNVQRLQATRPMSSDLSCRRRGFCTVEQILSTALEILIRCVSGFPRGEAWGLFVLALEMLKLQVGHGLHFKEQALH